MQNRKTLIIVFIPLVLLVIFVLLSLINKERFEYDAIQTHKISQYKNYTINPQQLKDKNKSASVILIDLRGEKEFRKGSIQNALNVPFSELLENEELIKLKSTDNELILYSSSLSTSAKAWIILVQSGYKNLYLLDASIESISENLILSDSILIPNEKLQFKFQPDSIH